ncbi:hypothetical protein VCJ_001608 [Vibrio metoecus]|nr:hypothetical protein VCJ_001608 [Vibrio metoecus]
MEKGLKSFNPFFLYRSLFPDNINYVIGVNERSQHRCSFK